MSYLVKNESSIAPNQSFTIVRKCSGCGKKSIYIISYKFRVNANGNRIDVWLIYQCRSSYIYQEVVFK